MNAQGQGYSAEHALVVATKAVGHVGHKLFDCFFHCVQNLAKAAWGIPLFRRLLIRIPCYDDQAIKQVQYTLKRSLFTSLQVDKSPACGINVVRTSIDITALIS